MTDALGERDKCRFAAGQVPAELVDQAVLISSAVRLERLMYVVHEHGGGVLVVHREGIGGIVDAPTSGLDGGPNLVRTHGEASTIWPATICRRTRSTTYARSTSSRRSNCCRSRWTMTATSPRRVRPIASSMYSSAAGVE